MNGSKGNAAFSAFEHPEGRDIVHNLNTANRMLPLVQRVVDDILADRKELCRLQPEQDRLERHKRELVWRERQHRYQVQEQLASTEQHLENALEELHSLGLVLLDTDMGQIGFPTLVNDRRAFFCWRPGEKSLTTWQFAEEPIPRPIPSVWWEVAEESVSAKN
ncbi:MAG TPA: DUF2203 family protein [Gemmataceae bacterium]|nr:DUF2203 family protein [Gemmataceae bacterium]